jgi:hypothetical protein
VEEVMPGPTVQRALRPTGDERKIPPADLWDKKIAEGMSPDSATAYVSRIHGAPPAAAAPARQPLIRNTQASTVRPDATASDRRVPADYYRDDLAGGLRTIEQGATLGFGDELNAGIRALMPGQTLADALADERTSVAGFRERHPSVRSARKYSAAWVAAKFSVWQDVQPACLAWLQRRRALGAHFAARPRELLSVVSPPLARPRAMWPTGSAPCLEGWRSAPRPRPR